ncbi:tobamovirus multiplication protein 1-like isoform X3 [Magnolia sinica]|uniref:tobamovirus multiplication protein 1-like isoform X3 n=1 Tax=Magnolia sinica TaxID=86752 RepID=UPI002658D264|nr:tobamovirus multiplication protein 1-like isoform X3 [Magnolia sinica]
MTTLPFNVSAVEPTATFDWWHEINESTKWQDGIFFFLCAAYALVSSVALIQLIRIQLRVPDFGWTTQKIFHLMNFIVNGVRAIVFGFHKQVFFLKPRLGLGRVKEKSRKQVFMLVLLNLPGILFFSTYTLLILFWVEIYNQARSLPTDKLRMVYFSVNGGIYFVQVCIWIVLWINDNNVVETIGNIFIAVVSFIAALGFLLYGGRLFFMLKRFPIESRGRTKKLQEVGVSAFDTDASLDVMDHPILNLIYYMLAEIMPSAFVLYILRKLPPKRVSAQYHPIH